VSAPAAEFESRKGLVYCTSWPWQIPHFSHSWSRCQLPSTTEYSSFLFKTLVCSL